MPSEELRGVVGKQDQKNYASFIDRMGNLASLPEIWLTRFARLVAKSNVTHIKRQHVADVYRAK